MPERIFLAVSKYQNQQINIPVRKTKGSAGYDLSSAENVEIKPNEIKLVPTGIKAYMLEDEVLKIYSRSSLAINKKLMMANGVGIIDSDYYNNTSNEGEIFIPLLNFGNETVSIQKGERVAQCIFEKILFSDSDDWELPTEIRTGGFGSTGNL